MQTLDWRRGVYYTKVLCSELLRQAQGDGEEREARGGRTRRRRRRRSKEEMESERIGKQI